MIGSLVARATVAALFWLAIVEADGSVLAYGVVAVPLAVALSYALTGRPRRSRGGRWTRGLAALRLGGWLLGRSVLGGVDVARRAVRLSSVRVDPYWTTYRTSLHTEGARIALVFLMNLIPGSLSASREGDLIEVHVIGTDLDMESGLAALEGRIARVAGDPSTDEDHG
ncbi:hypothetical protein BHE97_19225 [Aeromicrobium sp. PE09-221]|uniref:Na+/H+ antiporter subunit E n=1 Tax=Aeromicrobium sp. PE09-221 TaxID=1898043 RepID=UPI000B697924|nr:Na+/H+ antiporter subunit E [Aeromicrobium sp. PE09-221]OUZ06257.1 hypothetical protein BHE97_19225 [Aeromicrobium sp. PE09-221]